MKIQYTKSAQEFALKNPDVYFPWFVEECLGGIISLTGLSTPFVKGGIERLNYFFKHIKNKPNIFLSFPMLDHNERVPLNNNWEFLHKKCSIWCVTSLDSDNGEILKVNNIFVQDGVSEIRVPKPKGKPMDSFSNYRDNDNPTENTETSMDYLGVYVPKTGSILLYIDKIKNLPNPELIFQKVLLHEYMHAFMDINVRTIEIIGDMPKCTVLGNMQYSTYMEESLANALVLCIYEDWSDCDNIIKAKVRDFMKSQPMEYAKGLYIHDRGLTYLSEMLLEFLCEKGQPF